MGFYLSVQQFRSKVTHVNSQGKVTEYLVDSAGKLTKAP